MFAGQGHRSKVKITRSKNYAMGITMECLLGNRLSNITVKEYNDLGCFQSVCVFFSI